MIKTTGVVTHIATGDMIGFAVTLDGNGLVGNMEGVTVTFRKPSREPKQT